jgi:hypothetical protein
MVEDYKAHIEQLCRDNQIELELKPGYGGRAWRYRRKMARALGLNGKIKISPVKTHLTYAVALHEVGHILGTQGKHRIDRELNAWLWAMEHALIWTDVMEARKKRSLERYISWSIRRNGVIKPTSDHSIWAEVL